MYYNSYAGETVI